ncbi:hypothetical protein [Streptomyces sp. NPDC088554]|uniref:DprA-like winged helix domain-containing protein n=1 Tax=Streptomyces sp. NPDC088554 TaxID=3365865 RepID=UPI00382767B2
MTSPLTVPTVSALVRMTALGRQAAGDPPIRAMWEAYIRRSGMASAHRLVAYTIATHASYVTGEIPEDAPVAVEDLAVQTGLDPARVRVALAALEMRCLIKSPPRSRGSDGRAHPSSRITRLVLPTAILDRLRGA